MSSHHMLGQPALAQLIDRTNKSETEKKEQRILNPLRNLRIVIYRVVL